VIGLEQDGVDLALDEHNRGLITPEMERRLRQAKQDIIAGRIKVSEYRQP
jgi:basic membrane protein A